MDNAAIELAQELTEYTLDPLGYARIAYPWGTARLPTPSPRKWQAEILRGIGDHLQNPSTRHTLCSIAVASGHGIGKTALISMIANWAMDTCDLCKVLITANTATQLSTKTQPEVAKWFGLAASKPLWDVKATSITSRDPRAGREWRLDFVPWSENNTEAFQGLHNAFKRVVLILDEASAIADKIWEVSEGAMTDAQTELICIAFGNPTQNTGRFRECFGRFKHRWKTFQIDSRSVEGTNKEQIAKWVEDYGEDSDFVRVRVRGEFPRAGSSQFIPSDVVAAARHYQASGYERLPKILACDVARFGDDQTVIVVRQGRRSRILGKYRGLDTEQTAQRLIEFVEQEQPQATVIDGDGVGGGVVDHMKHRGYKDKAKVFEFHGGATPTDAEMYLNRRAEVWGLMKEWLVAGAQIPDDPELGVELEAQPYDISRGKNDGKLLLITKQDMKKLGLASPDIADALAMTFGVKVAPPPKPQTQFVTAGMNEGSWMA